MATAYQRAYWSRETFDINHNSCFSSAGLANIKRLAAAGEVILV